MNQLLSDNILAGGYLIVWTITLIWYQFLNRRMDGGTAVISAYIFYAIFSLLTITDPLFSMAFNKLKLFPYIYLYTVQMLTLAPVIYHHTHPVNEIVDPNTKVIKLLCLLIIGCSVLLIPDLISAGSSGILQLFTDANAGKEAYMEQIEMVQDSGKAIRNIPGVLYNMLSDITVFLFFYILTLGNKNKWIIFGMVFSVLVGIIQPILRGQRGGVVTGMLTVIGGYMLFQPYISQSIRKYTRNIGIAALIAFSIPIIAITFSRFGKEGSGVGGFVNWYVGQGSLYFNNYALNPGGTRNGDRTVNYFKRLVTNDVPNNFVERRDKYHNLELDDNYFSTFVGDFCIDFGPIVTFIIFMAFAVIMTYYVRTKNKKITVYQLLLIFFALCISLQGGMTLFSYSDSGNLRIVCLLLFYAYLRYHEILLRKYPLTSTENKDEM